MEDSITEAELVTAMSDYGYDNVYNRARNLVKSALNHRTRERPRSALGGGNETITRDELDASLARLSYGVLHSAQIFKDIIEHREPEWQQGDVVQDANGVFYRRTRDAMWNRFGTATSISHLAPVRPLEKVGTQL
jgi:hypothetical protein